VDFDPTSSEFRQDPYSVYKRLRDEAPVAEIPSFGVYYLSRYADVLSAFKQPIAFSSAGMRAIMSGQTGMMGTGNELDEEFREADNLIATDPPVHDRLRNIVNRGFTPRQIAALEPRVRAIAEELVDGIVASGGVADLVYELTIPLPVRVIAELLGVEPGRYREFKRWSDALVTTSTGTGPIADPEQANADRQALMDFLAGEIADRRAHPRDDLISTLISGGPTGQALSDPEAQTFAVLLLAAGNETTTNLLGNAMQALVAHPDQLRKVRENPELIPPMLEETLRYDGPIQCLFRQASEDVEIGGTTIPQGRFVMLLLASANRDERQFEEPDRFDITRSTSGHLAFGFGVHFCLGASLARLEARVALEALFARCTDFEIDGDEVEPLESMIVRGPKALPMSFRSLG
jgi:cytochrome P450